MATAQPLSPSNGPISPSATTTSPSGPPRAADSHSNRVDLISSQAGRILCVSDIRGSISTFNKLAAEHNAVAIIHSGDFGFYEPSSLASISDRTLRHLIQYSSLISPVFRSQLLGPSTTPAQMRELLSSTLPFGLSEFPLLLSGELKLNVPVYTVWGACEDVAILEKIRLAAPSVLTVPKDPSAPIAAAPPATTGANGVTTTTTSGYSIPNLTVLDEATTRVLVIGGVRLRLFGLGGAVVQHKLFDNGVGSATIAGGGGTMWTTVLQVGEIVDTAQKVYDPTETRLLVSHASPGREGLLTQLSLVLKADLTLSAGLHFRYGVSYNEFSVQHDPEAFRAKLEWAKKTFNEVWDTVKTQVEGVVDENQKALLANALAVANRVPSAPPAGGAATEETAWKNCWNWNLPDAAFGSLVLDIRDGRIGSEMKSQGFNFAYRQSSTRSTVPPAPVATAAPSLPLPSPAPQPAPPTAAATPLGPIATKPLPPSAPSTGPNRPPSQPRNQNSGPLPPRNATRTPSTGGGRGGHQQRYSGGWGPAAATAGNLSGGEGGKKSGGEEKEKKEEAVKVESAEKKDDSTTTTATAATTVASKDDVVPKPATTPSGSKPPRAPRPPKDASSTVGPTGTGEESSSAGENNSTLASPREGGGRGRGTRGTGRGGRGGAARGGDRTGRGRGGRGGESAGATEGGATPTTATEGGAGVTPSQASRKAGSQGGGW